MTFTAKVLGEGQLAAAKSTIYPTPALTKTYVKYMSFYNASAGSQTVNVYLNLTGTSRQIRRAILAANETLIIDESITLETGDLIEASASSATSVDYVVTGGEET